MADLVMMQCARRDLRLSVAGCARLWLAADAKRPEAWESHVKCQFCPVGAANAGRDVAPLSEVTAELRVHCVRCEKITDRLINSRFCPSCYNRHRESQVGANAKGSRPAICDQLFTARVAVSRGSAPPVVHHSDKVLSQPESLVTMARSATTPLRFGMAAVMLQPSGWQTEMAI